MRARVMVRRRASFIRSADFEMRRDPPNPIRVGVPCPECGGTRFESFALAMGEAETPNGPGSVSRDLACCVACGACLRGVDSAWTPISEVEFERAVAVDRELVERVRRQMRSPGNVSSAVAPSQRTRLG